MGKLPRLFALALLLHGISGTSQHYATCTTCSSYAYLVDRDATQYCQDKDSKCWDPSDCTGAGSLCNVDKDHPAEYPPEGANGTGIATCNACSSYEYLEGAGETYYCQDNNDKCWNSIDCTGVGRLCQAAKQGCTSNKYTWIGASAGSDGWCNENCNHDPSYCPAEDCTCTATDTCSTDTSVCQCPYGPVHQFCVSDTDCPTEGSYCMSGEGKASPFVCHVPNKQLSMTVQIHNVSSSDFMHDQQQVFRQAIWSGIKAYVRSIDNIAYTSNDNSNEKYSQNTRPLLSEADKEPAGRRSGKLSCQWIGPSAGSDSWCNSNCNRNPSFCPASSCSCSDAKPPQTPTHPTTPTHPSTQTRNKLSCQWIGTSAGSDSWCNSNCNNNPSFCPAEDCLCSGSSTKVISSDYCSIKYLNNKHGQCDKDSKCRWLRGSGKNHCMASTICNPCSSYAFLQVGYSSYCQDSDDKCWSSADCTGVGSLCTVGIPASIPQCCPSLCAAKPTITTAPTAAPSDTAAPTAAPSNTAAPPAQPTPSVTDQIIFVNNCTTDSDCGVGGLSENDGNYCMIDPTKTPPYACHSSSVYVSFNISLSNASKDLYNSAVRTLNQHMDTNRRSSSITTMTNSIASASKVTNMQVSGVTVLAKAQTYDQYCDTKTAADGCVTAVTDPSSDSGLSTVGIVLIVMGFMIAVAAVAGGLWFYNSRKVGSGSMNEALLPDGQCDNQIAYERMPDISNSHPGCNKSGSMSIFD